MPEPTLFPNTTDELLISVYQKQARTLDDLPYTDEFEVIFAAIDGRPGNGPRCELFHRLHNLRKAAMLPRLGRALTKPLVVSHDQEQLLVQLVEERIGKLSNRDQLLYTADFDAIVERFNTQAGLQLTPHDLWRIIATLAK